MRTIPLTAILIAASVSAVPAAPADKESTERVSYTDRAHRDRQRWVELASPTPASHVREYITVAGTYAMLRIDAAAGSPTIRSVRVRYKDGTERVVRLDQVLTRKAPSAYVDLRGARLIDHVVVITAPSKATYVVYGTSEAPSHVAAR